MARCVINVVGVADRLTGTSKNTGKAYDMCEIAYTFKNQFQKNCVACSMIDGTIMDEFDIHVGQTFDAIVNQFNGKSYIDLISEVF